MAVTEVNPTPEIEWDLVDRLHKSLRLAGLKPGDMAKHLDLHRNTVTGWLHGKHRMTKAALIAWAAKCSETSPVPITFEWLTVNIAHSWLDGTSTLVDQLALLDDAQQPVDFGYPRYANVIPLASRRAS